MVLLRARIFFKEVEKKTGIQASLEGVPTKGGRKTCGIMTGLV